MIDQAVVGGGAGGCRISWTRAEKVAVENGFGN